MIGHTVFSSQINSEVASEGDSNAGVFGAFLKPKNESLHQNNFLLTLFLDSFRLLTLGFFWWSASSPGWGYYLWNLPLQFFFEI